MNKAEERMVGNFISLVTLRSDVSSSTISSRQKYLSYVHNSIYLAMKYQDYQFDELVNAQGYGLEQDRFPLTTFFISMLNKRMQQATAHGSVFEHRDMGCDVKFDMMLYVDAYADQLVLRTQYRRSLFSHQDQVQLWRCFLARLSDLLEGDLSCGLY